jgi:hypothetical protein
LLTAALRGGGGGLSTDQERTFDDYKRLAEGGSSALIGHGADSEGRKRAIEVIADYEALAAVAMAVPRLRTIREYLEATGLGRNLDGNPVFAGNRAVASLETECQLLLAAVAPSALLGSARNLDALEARFHQFKLNYVRLYRDAHAQWCREMARLEERAGEVRLYLEALGRLNRITALGPANGVELAPRLEAITSALKRCNVQEEVVSEVRPCCAECGFVIGAELPDEGLQELHESARRALDGRLALLSQSAIARLIQQHDREGRLEGFLKITQAAQTRALIRVLDDKLAAYLDDLLNENPRSGAPAAPAAKAGSAVGQGSSRRVPIEARNLPVRGNRS